MNYSPEENAVRFLLTPEYMNEFFQWLEGKRKARKRPEAILRGILEVIDFETWDLFWNALSSPVEISDEVMQSGQYMLLVEAGFANVMAVSGPGIPCSYTFVLTEGTKRLYDTTLREFLSRKVSVGTYT